MNYILRANNNHINNTIKCNFNVKNLFIVIILNINYLYKNYFKKSCFFSIKLVLFTRNPRFL